MLTIRNEKSIANLRTRTRTEAVNIAFHLFRAHIVMLTLLIIHLWVVYSWYERMLCHCPLLFHTVLVCHSVCFTRSIRTMQRLIFYYCFVLYFTMNYMFYCSTVDKYYKNRYCKTFS